MPGRTLESLYWQSKAANELARISLAELEKLPPSVESHQVLGRTLQKPGKKRRLLK
ncbi:MAG: hypothetical protein QM757_22705 [Paludibaculum sp.]